MDETEASRAGAPAKPSKIPSWIMLGFLLGAFFVWMLPRPREAETPAVSAPVRPPPQLVATHPRFSDVEASFLEWHQRYAVWAGDVTYVCMWDTASLSFRDCYQVLRQGDEFFFRSVPRPANLRAREGVPENSPLQFLIPIPEERNLLWERPAAPVLAPDKPSK